MPPRSISLIPHTKFFICPRCRFRTSNSNSNSILTPSPSTNHCLLSTTRKQRTSLHDTATAITTPKFAQLKHRALIRLAGPDAANFLHNIIPAKILGVGTNPVYTAFLSAHGRILSDVFIYPPSWDGDSKHEWLIEVDGESAGELLKHLRKHKLRSKFHMERVDGDGKGDGGRMGVVYSWPTLDRHSGGSEALNKLLRAGGQDPRFGMGRRLIVDDTSKAEVIQRLKEEGVQEGSLEEYTVHRMLNGAAEGPKEIIPGHALPQESNIDLIGGIDFHKGCYLGQELTIRTHHTGVVRKRIIPCQIYNDDNNGATSTSTLAAEQSTPDYSPDTDLPQPPPESNLSKLTTRKGRSTGKWLDGVGNIGLALCRLEMMTNIQLTADTTNYDPSEEYRVQWEDTGGVEDGQKSSAREVRIKPFVPGWVREGIEQSLRRKEKRPKKRREDEEDDEDEVD